MRPINLESAAIFDVDGDGDPDILVKVFRFTVPHLDIWLNNR